MCYPYPGPRCSAHAHSDWLAALQRYENEQDPDRKLSFKEDLETKQAIFDATPRGQNNLRREQAESHDKEQQSQLYARIVAGKELRDNQMAAYYAIKDDLYTDDAPQKEVLAQNNIAGRYALAAAVAYERVLDILDGEGAEAHLISKDTITVNLPDQDPYKILVLPTKYQAAWKQATQNSPGTYSTGDSQLDDILSSSRRYTNLGAEETQKVNGWAVAHLEAEGYKVIALTHPAGRDITFISTQELPKFTNSELKLRKRFSGTTPYQGTAENVKEAITGTIFETGSLVTLPNSKRILITGVPPQAKDTCKLGGLWMSHKQTDTESWFEVRVSAPITRYDVHLLIKARRDIPSGTSTAAMNILTSKAEKPENQPTD